MFLSIDIGGTKTLLALFSYHGFCLKRRIFPTTGNSSVYLSDLRENLEQLIDSSRLRKKILAITVAIPGKIIITENSYTFLCPNIPWSEINLYETLKNLFPDSKIFFANDANLATLYETSRLKPADRLKKTIYLTFSTGIGGGISENGHLLPRSDAFEPGHIIYPSQTEEWEKLASAKALSNLYQSKLSDLKPTPEILSDITKKLVPGLTYIAQQENPAQIIIGGPLAYLFNQLKPSLVSTLKQALKGSKSPVSRVLATTVIPNLSRAKRPSESVIYGAYLYSKTNYNK